MIHTLDDGPVRGVVYVTPAGSRVAYSKPGALGQVIFRYIDGPKDGLEVSEAFFSQYMRPESRAVRVPE